MNKQEFCDKQDVLIVTLLGLPNLALQVPSAAFTKRYDSF